MILDLNNKKHVKILSDKFTEEEIEEIREFLFNIFYENFPHHKNDVNCVDEYKVKYDYDRYK